MNKDPLDQYFERTGQSWEEVFAGVSQVGMDYVINKLIPMALEQNKTIIWIIDDPELGTGEYVLRDLEH